MLILSSVNFSYRNRSTRIEIIFWCLNNINNLTITNYILHYIYQGNLIKYVQTILLPFIFTCVISYFTIHKRKMRREAERREKRNIETEQTATVQTTQIICARI